MEYNLNRDFNDSFNISFKRYTSTEDLQGAVDRYITTQGNQAGVHNLAEVLINMAYNYTPDIAEEVVPNIYSYVRHNGNQAGMQMLTETLYAIIEEGITDSDDASEQEELVDLFVKQNACQTGLPILLEDGTSYTFGAFLKDLITTLDS